MAQSKYLAGWRRRWAAERMSAAMSDFRQYHVGDGGTIDVMTTATASPPTALWRDFERCYRAVASRDARFDGQVITAVRTTGIYCRPSCPAQTPRERNVRFYPTAAAAQAAGFRACRRCLPDAVPGSPEWNVRADLAARAMRLIVDGVVERDGVAGLARQLGYSERQLGRVLTTELGAGPLSLARAHRAHTARLLIERTDLPMTDVAFAAGFASVRQFNATVQEVFARTPSQLRARSSVRHADDVEAGVAVRLRLPVRQPFDGSGVLDFLATRAIPGVESCVDGRYARTLRLPHGAATVRATPAADHVDCDVRLADVRDLASAVARVRRLFDLDADPVAVDAVLASSAGLAPSVDRVPGIRVPGAVDGFELLVRAMIGQQISVAAARTAAGRLVASCGPPLPDADGALTHLFPSAADVAASGDLRGPRRRVDAVRAAARRIADGELEVHIGRDADGLRDDLAALDGVGAWTADYVLMRVLGHTDIALATDLGVQRGAATLSLPSRPSALAGYLETLRPWRSYAVMHLWRAAGMRAPTKGARR